MPLVRIDEEEKRRIVDVAIAAARVQSKRSKSKVSPEEAMHRALGRYTLLRKADDCERLCGAVLYSDEIAEQRGMPTATAARRSNMASVRYIVTDVDSALAFYRDLLEFELDMHNPGKFAALRRQDITLYLSAPGAGSGGSAGGTPEPGGWNRFMLVTDDIDSLIGRLGRAGARFKGEISEGGAGRARLVQDPSGNLIELFELKKK